MFYAMGTGSRIQIGEPSAAGHSFGGSGGFSCYSKNHRLKCLRHVLTLRTCDPLVTTDRQAIVVDAFRNAIPIYYDPDHATDIQYLVNEEDMMIHVLSREVAVVGLTFPLQRANTEWEQRPFSLKAIPYELARTLGWVSLARAHNLQLSDEDRAVAEESSYPFHQWGGFFELPSPDDWVFHKCLNPKCPNYKGSMGLHGVLLDELTESQRLVDPPSGQLNEQFHLLIELCGLCPAVQTSLRSWMGQVEPWVVE